MLIKGLVTSTASFQYFLRGYLDPAPDSRVDGLRYQNNAFRNCSIQLIEMSQFLWSPIEDQASTVCYRPNQKEWVACNTTAAQYISISTTRDGVALAGNAYNPLGSSSYLPTTGPLNATFVAHWWGVVVYAVTQAFAPIGELSPFLHPCLTANKLGSLRFAYYGIPRVARC
jgi:hypothetical protein